MGIWPTKVIMQEESLIPTLRTILNFKERVDVLSVAIG